MFPDGPVPLDEIVARLAALLAASPADSTEISWMEVRRGQESNGKRRRDSYEVHERTVMLRVRESGRTGVHRTSLSRPSDLEAALRDAMAAARLSLPTPEPLPPPGHDVRAAIDGLFDPELQGMTPGRAREMLQRLAGRGETARIGWAEGRVAVANSRGLRREQKVTSSWLEVICGRGPGAGRATGASRSLAGLDAPGVFERARRHQAPTDVVPPPPAPCSAVFAPEAVATLVELLNRNALTSESCLAGVSYLFANLGHQVFDTKITLRDDPTDPRGLPFPFDLLGSAARPLDLVAEGVARSCAVDDRLAQRSGQPATPNLIAPGEAVPTHLFLLPGEASEEQLLERAEEGLWIAALDPIECFDAHALRFRAVARGVRRIVWGQLGLGVPDLILEGTLLLLLSRVLAVGAELNRVATGSGLFRATTTPALALAGVDGYRILVE